LHLQIAGFGFEPTGDESRQILVGQGKGLLELVVVERSGGAIEQCDFLRELLAGLRRDAWVSW